MGAPLHASTLSWPFALHVVMSVFQRHPLQSSHPRRLPQGPQVCSLHPSPLWCPACRIVVTPTHLLMPRPPGADPQLPEPPGALPRGQAGSQTCPSPAPALPARVALGAAAAPRFCYDRPVLGPGEACAGEAAAAPVEQALVKHWCPGPPAPHGLCF